MVVQQLGFKLFKDQSGWFQMDRPVDEMDPLNSWLFFFNGPCTPKDAN